MVNDTLPYLITFIFIFFSAICGGLVCRYLKLPMLLGYIVVGLLAGNIFPSIARSNLLIPIADIGVTLLMFSVGIEFSFHRLRRILKQAVWAAAAQLSICIFVFLALFQFFSMSFLESLYLAVALSLSSTAIIVKFLSERGEMDTVPGELSIGWLAVQDFSVILFIILLSSLSDIARLPVFSVTSLVWVILLSVIKSAVVLYIVIILGKHAIPKLLDLIAGLHNRELFLLSTIGLIFGFSALTYRMGFSAPLGAFLAGLLVAETSQNHAIFSEIRPLRDIFTVLFFVSIGMALKIADISAVWKILILITIITVLTKSSVIYLISRFLGFHQKTAFFVALALIPVSEFAFVLAQEGVRSGAIPVNYLVLTVGLVFSTAFTGIPLLTNANKLYYQFLPRLSKRIKPIDGLRYKETPENEGFPISNHVVICGYGRVGRYIGRALLMGQIPFLVVDYNNSVIRELRDKGISVVYGDPADISVLDYAQVDLAKTLIIAIPDRHTQEMIIANAQILNKHIRIICRTHHEEDQKRLKSLGVQSVIQPEFEAAVSISQKILTDFGVSGDEISGKISRLKIEHGLG